jgi:hypothetical protein
MDEIMKTVRKKEIICKLLSVRPITYYRVYTIINRYIFKLYYPLNDVSKFEIRSKVKLTINLALIESVMYLIDQLAEDGKEECFEKEVGTYFDELDSIKNKFLSILALLKVKSSGVERYIDMGERYVRAENKIVRSGYKNVSLQDVKEVIELRSSDVRLLHFIIVNELDIKENSDLVNVLWHLEIISEFENDLDDYKKDKVNENFNLIIMYEKIYGKRTFCKEIMRVVSVYLQNLNDLLDKLTNQEKEVINGVLNKSMKKIIVSILELGNAQDIMFAYGEIVSSKSLLL